MRVPPCHPSIRSQAQAVSRRVSRVLRLVQLLLTCTVLVLSTAPRPVLALDRAEIALVVGVSSPAPDPKPTRKTHAKWVPAHRPGPRASRSSNHAGWAATVAPPRELDRYLLFCSLLC